eukprot:11169288-Lingulodinium_polyedra.AAC.1
MGHARAIEQSTAETICTLDAWAWSRGITNTLDVGCAWRVRQRTRATSDGINAWLFHFHSHNTRLRNPH